MVAQIDGGWEHTCARAATGELRCWGRAAEGELGLGDTVQLGDQANEMPPADIELGASTTDLTSTYLASCVRTTTNGVRCWGEGSWGNLGYSSTANVGDDELPSALGDVMIE